MAVHWVANWAALRAVLKVDSRAALRVHSMVAKKAAWKDANSVEYLVASMGFPWVDSKVAYLGTALAACSAAY